MEEFVYPFKHSFLKGCFMGTAIRGVLAVYITMIAFTIAISMSK